MAHYRAEYRAAARAAMAADAALSGITQMTAWTERIDTMAMPLICVVTPSEKSRPSAHGQTERGTLLQVVLKRAGGTEIEDQLDLDADAIEAAVIGALMTRETECTTDEVTTVTSGDGSSRIGTVVVNFRVTSWRGR
ncbi:hypothetical protein [Sinirhodobacter huangdaonensis]|uniref:DUF3168 domain-containing protein n=1 Tax=Paenirhodobacter huangdaonensis TaxID=2501515 RepID=A0A443M080_9RHOB|nr:hypothetical protein [Sinirhodobacter huangdaonensis]RWR54887.1 hypothetical protein EOW66_02135 [Sinirhodobacter huangdaonensis]